MLTRKYDATENRRILNNFKILVKIVAVDEKVIGLALSSKFPDFEDAIQYFAAVENNINILLTRNTKDYKLSKIAILTADAYLKQV